MTYSMQEVVFGGLLHDIGKMLQRAFDRPEDISGQTYDLESTLCPLSKEGRYTHKHVLFTEAFFELLNCSHINLPAGIDFNMVSKIACYHHKPDSCDYSVAAAWLCTLADPYSAGMDRRAEEETGKHFKAFRTTPLRCIFDELILDKEKLGSPEPHAYTLDLLQSDDENGLIPLPWPTDGKQDDLPLRYKKVWHVFLEEFNLLIKGKDLSSQLFEEALLGLLERTTWAIPSSTIDLPDISLFDHVRTTAAIAACLYRYHEVNGGLDSESAIKESTRPKFQFLAGDLSGIQATLLNLASQGVKGGNKILRARSYILGAIAEAAALQVIKTLRMPLCSIIQQAGGRFLILLPAIIETKSVVENLRYQCDQWLLENFTGTLALNLALSEPFAGEAFGSGQLGIVMDNLGKTIEEAKQTPLIYCTQGVLKREFPLDCACSACGTRPAESRDGDESRCPACQREVEIGKRLVDADLIVWGERLPEKCRPINILGLELALVAKDALPPLGSVLSIRKAHLVETPIPWAERLLANHIPVFKNEYELKDPRYESFRDETPRVGEPKTFMHIAAEAIEFDEDGGLRGKPYLALLKADVDYLGFLFHYGLERVDRKGSHLTLSRLAQLSRMMDLYFTGYLKGLLHREFPNTYTVYAGGDDLLLIGPWRQTLTLARRINETFQEYTGYNPNITLSAGISLLKANYPVNRAVWEAQDFLELSKDEGRNRICAFMSPSMTWDQYTECLRDAEWIHDQMHEKTPVSTGFVYRIMEIARDVEDAVIGDVRKANWRSRLAYHLARNIRGADEADKKRKIVEWLKHLGLDDQLKLIKKHSNLYRWRLPLSIALYRNRR